MGTSGTQKANTIGSGERTYVSFLNGKIRGTADFSSCIEEGRRNFAVGKDHGQSISRSLP